MNASDLRAELSRLPADAQEVVREAQDIGLALSPRLIRFAQHWPNRLGTERFWAVFWAQAGLGVRELPRIEMAMMAAAQDGDVPQGFKTPTREVYLRFGSIIRETLRRCGTMTGDELRDWNKTAVDDAKQDLGIDRASHKPPSDSPPVEPIDPPPSNITPIRREQIQAPPPQPPMEWSGMAVQELGEDFE